MVCKCNKAQQLSARGKSVSVTFNLQVILGHHDLRLLAPKGYCAILPDAKLQKSKVQCNISQPQEVQEKFALPKKDNDDKFNSETPY